MSIKFNLVDNVSRRDFAKGAAIAGAALATSSLATTALAEEEAPDTITGASVAVDPDGQMEQEAIRELALDYLRGFPLGTDENGETIWSYREMYAIATCYNNHPGLSQVEFTLNPETMCLVCSSEKGTEKCEHLKYNPEVVLYWYHQIGEDEYVPGVNDYFNSWGVQIKGRARFLEAESPELNDMVGRYYETLLGSEVWGAISPEDQEARIQMLLTVNDVIIVEPTEYNVTSLGWAFNKEDSRRPTLYDPENPYFGYDARQVYYPKAAR